MLLLRGVIAKLSCWLFLDCIDAEYDSDDEQNDMTRLPSKMKPKHHIIYCTKGSLWPGMITRKGCQGDRLHVLKMKPIYLYRGLWHWSDVTDSIKMLQISEFIKEPVRFRGQSHKVPEILKHWPSIH